MRIPPCFVVKSRLFKIFFRCDLKLTIREVCQKFGVSKDTCIKALQRGYLAGNKEYEKWLVEEKDAEKYFAEPQSPDWLPLNLTADLFQIPKNSLIESIENGRILGRKHKNKWYICVKTMEKMQNLVKKREKKANLVSISGHFVVKNPIIGDF